MDSFYRLLGEMTPRTVVRRQLDVLPTQETPVPLTSRHKSTWETKDKKKSKDGEDELRMLLRRRRSHQAATPTAVNTSDMRGTDQTYANLTALGSDESTSDESIDLDAAAKFLKKKFKKPVELPAEVGTLASQLVAKPPKAPSTKKRKVTEDAKPESNRKRSIVNKTDDVEKTLLSDMCGTDQTYANLTALGSDESTIDESIDLDAAAKFLKKKFKKPVELPAEVGTLASQLVAKPPKAPTTKKRKVTEDAKPESNRKRSMVNKSGDVEKTLLGNVSTSTIDSSSDSISYEAPKGLFGSQKKLVVSLPKFDAKEYTVSKDSHKSSRIDSYPAKSSLGKGADDMFDISAINDTATSWDLSNISRLHKTHNTTAGHEESFERAQSDAYQWVAHTRMAPKKKLQLDLTGLFHEYKEVPLETAATEEGSMKATTETATDDTPHTSSTENLKEGSSCQTRRDIASLSPQSRLSSLGPKSISPRSETPSLGHNTASPGSRTLSHRSMTVSGKKITSPRSKIISPKPKIASSPSETLSLSSKLASPGPKAAALQAKNATPGSGSSPSLRPRIDTPDHRTLLRHKTASPEFKTHPLRSRTPSPGSRTPIRHETASPGSPSLRAKTASPGSRTPSLRAKTASPGSRTPSLRAKIASPGSRTPSLSAKTASPGSRTPLRAKAASPGSRTPIRHETASPGSRTPLMHETTSPGSRTPLRYETTSPGSRTPLGHETASPGSRTPLRLETASPGSRTPIRHETASPGSRSPLRAKIASPGSRTPSLSAKTASPGSRTPLRAKAASPGSRTPLRAKTASPGSRTPSLRAKTASPGSRTPSLRAKTASPGSRTPSLRAKIASPGSRTPSLSAKTASPGSRTPLRAKAASPGSRTPLRAKTASPGSRTPSLRAKTASPGSRTPSLRAKTASPGSRTPSLRAKTASPGSRTPSLRAKTASPGSRTPSLRAKTASPGSRTPSLRAKTASPGSRTPSLRAKTASPSSRTQSLRAKTASPGSRTPSLRAKTASPDSRTPSLRAKTASPRSRTPSLRAKTASPGSRTPLQSRTASPGYRTRSASIANKTVFPKAVRSPLPVATSPQSESDTKTEMEKMEPGETPIPPPPNFQDYNENDEVVRSSFSSNDDELDVNVSRALFLLETEVEEEGMDDRTTKSSVSVQNSLSEPAVKVTNSLSLRMSPRKMVSKNLFATPLKSPRSIAGKEKSLYHQERMDSPSKMIIASTATPSPFKKTISPPVKETKDSPTSASPSKKKTTSPTSVSASKTIIRKSTGVVGNKASNMTREGEDERDITNSFSVVRSHSAQVQGRTGSITENLTFTSPSTVVSTPVRNLSSELANLPDSSEENELQKAQPKITIKQTVTVAEVHRASEQEEEELVQFESEEIVMKVGDSNEMAKADAGEMRVDVVDNEEVVEVDEEVVDDEEVLTGDEEGLEEDEDLDVGTEEMVEVESEEEVVDKENDEAVEVEDEEEAVEIDEEEAVEIQEEKAVEIGDEAVDVNEVDEESVDTVRRSILGEKLVEDDKEEDEVEEDAIEVADEEEVPEERMLVEEAELVKSVIVGGGKVDKEVESEDFELDLLPVVIRKSTLARKAREEEVAASMMKMTVEKYNTSDQGDQPEDGEEVSAAESAGDNSMSETAPQLNPSQLKQLTMKEFLQILATKPAEIPTVSTSAKTRLADMVRKMQEPLGGPSKAKTPGKTKGVASKKKVQKKVQLPASLGNSVTMQAFNHFARCQTSAGAAKEIMKVSEQWWANCSRDLQALTQIRQDNLASRISAEDVAKLFRRQKLATTQNELNALAEKFLPAEEWQYFRPAAYAHGIIHPSNVYPVLPDIP